MALLIEYIRWIFLTSLSIKCTDCNGQEKMLLHNTLAFAVQS